MNKFYWDTSPHSLLPAILSSFFCLHTNGIIFGVALVSKTIFCMLHNIISRAGLEYLCYLWTLQQYQESCVIWKYANSSSPPPTTLSSSIDFEIHLKIPENLFSASRPTPLFSLPIPQIMHNRFVYILRLCKIRNHHHRTGDFRFVADGR